MKYNNGLIEFDIPGTRLESNLIEGKYFVTSRLVGDRRRYTIRKLTEGNEVRVFGSLDGFSTRVGAVRWLTGNH
jgi:hypothetical protein